MSQDNDFAHQKGRIAQYNPPQRFHKPFEFRYWPLAKRHHQISHLGIGENRKASANQGMPPTSIITAIFAPRVAFKLRRKKVASFDTRKLEHGRLVVHAQITLSWRVMMIVRPVSLLEGIYPVVTIPAQSVQQDNNGLAGVGRSGWYAGVKATHLCLKL
jgi:hypothetical protein